MKFTSCSQNFEHQSRVARFAGGEKMKGPEAQREVPKAEEITKEHLDKVIKAVDSNIKSVEDYYNDYITREFQGDTMPKKVESQLRELKALRSQLNQLRSNPKNSRQVLVNIFKIFEDLDRHAKTTQESAKGDPLAGLGLDTMYKPELRAEKKPVAAAKAPDAKEAQELSREKLAWNAVENIARAGGTLTQDMLDALKTYKKGQKVLYFNLKIEGNPVSVIVERGPDGFAATGGSINQEKLRPNEAPVWKSATFNYSHSFKAGDENPPAIKPRPVEQHIASIEKGELIPEKEV